jgi:hypothetical protein
MINSTSHQAWLFYSRLALQAALLKDDLLDPVDQLLEDPALLELVQQSGSQASDVGWIPIAWARNICAESWQSG